MILFLVSLEEKKYWRRMCEVAVDQIKNQQIFYGWIIEMKYTTDLYIEAYTNTIWNLILIIITSKTETYV